MHINLSRITFVSGNDYTVTPGKIKTVVADAPNPFATQTTFTLQLDAPENVRLEIFNLSGQRLYMSDNQFPAGSQTLKLPQEAMAPGTVGYYRLQAGEKWTSGKLIRL